DFAPSNELSRLLGLAHVVAGDGTLVARCDEAGESSDPHVHIVGEAARFGGAHVAMAAGRLAGLAIARKLGFAAEPDPGAQRRLNRARRFQQALWQLFRPAEDAQADAVG